MAEPKTNPLKFGKPGTEMQEKVVFTPPPQVTQPAATRKTEEEPEKVKYSSHPQTRLIIGPYQFKDGKLSLSQEDSVKFDALLASMPKIETNKIKKLDHNAAERMIADHKSRISKGIDSTAGSVGPNATAV